MSSIFTDPATVATVCTALAAAWLYVWHLHRRLTAATFDATHDPLTGLYNRRTLQWVVHAAIAAGRPFATVLLDIDWFKDLNDRYGHAAGDAVLIELARRLATTDDSVTHLFRLGGDEFAAIVTGDDDHAITVGKHIWTLAAGDEFLLPGGWRVGVHVSVGVASHRLGIDPTTLLRQADTALAHAKADHTVMRWHPGTPTPAIQPRPRHRQRDHRAPTLQPTADWGMPWRCWFDAAEVAPLADHAAGTPHHQRTNGEHDLIQDCPGGLAILADGGHVTAFSTGFPQPLRDPHNPDTVAYAAAIDHDDPPNPDVAYQPLVAHIHLDGEAIDAIHHGADWGGLIEVTVTGEHATFALTRPSTAQHHAAHPH